MRFIAAVGIALLCLGCGIGDAMGDECGGYKSAYESLSRLSAGLAKRGVSPDAPIVRHTNERVAQARAAATACTAEQSG